MGAQGPDPLRRSQSFSYIHLKSIAKIIPPCHIWPLSSHAVSQGRAACQMQHNPPAKVPLAADILGAHGSLPCIGPPPAEALGLLVHSRLSIRCSLLTCRAHVVELMATPSTVRRCALHERGSIT